MGRQRGLETQNLAGHLEADIVEGRLQPGDRLEERGLAPHGFCLLWDPALIWTHVTADLLIGLAYGAGSWAVFEAVVAPRVGQEREGGTQQDVALLADHLLYGGVLARLAR